MYCKATYNLAHKLYVKTENQRSKTLMCELRNNAAETDSYEATVYRASRSSFNYGIPKCCPPMPSALLRLVNLSAFVFSSTWNPFPRVFTLCLCPSVAQRLQMRVLHQDKMIGVMSVLGLQPLAVVWPCFLLSCSLVRVSSRCFIFISLFF